VGSGSCAAQELSGRLHKKDINIHRAEMNFPNAQDILLQILETRALKILQKNFPKILTSSGASKSVAD
jgi:ABC-type uncharacterized transport system ATPase component